MFQERRILAMTLKLKRNIISMLLCNIILTIKPRSSTGAAYSTSCLNSAINSTLTCKLDYLHLLRFSLFSTYIDHSSFRKITITKFRTLKIPNPSSCRRMALLSSLYFARCLFSGTCSLPASLSAPTVSGRVSLKTVPAAL